MSEQKKKNTEAKTAHRRQIAVIKDPNKQEKLSDKLYTTMDKILEFAEKVFTSDEQITVSRWTKDGKVETYKTDKYTTDHKIKVMEILTPKCFADKKDVNVTGDPTKPVPVAFSFVPVQKNKED